MTKATNPSIKECLTNPIHGLAFGFGSGLAPFAPGTFGTLVAIPIYLTATALITVSLFGCIAGVDLALSLYLWRVGKAAKHT